MQAGCKTCAQLLRHLNDRSFVTGTVLGQELSISRAAVHKHIESLKTEGLPVEGVSGRGYRLARGVVPLSESRIRTRMGRHADRLVRKLLIERSVQSTNSLLLALANNESIHRVACLTEAQPSGRGRRGRAWITTPYRNLLMSLGWVYDDWPRDVTGLSLAAGIAVIDALRHLGVGGLGMKWPNDILLDGRKLGGILIEVSGEASGTCTLVIGIGINLHIGEHDASLIDQPWIDLQQALGRSVDRNELAAACLTSLCAMLRDYPETGFEPWRDKWAGVDVLSGRQVVMTVHQSGPSFEGVAVGIDAGGALRVAVEGEGTRTFLSGEVSVRTR